jgi:hypothetical protein
MWEEWFEDTEPTIRPRKLKLSSSPPKTAVPHRKFQIAAQAHTTTSLSPRNLRQTAFSGCCTTALPVPMAAKSNLGNFQARPLKIAGARRAELL